MSMVASLDALEAVTDAKAAPRAAVFQPKVRARVKKGGAGSSSANALLAKSRATPPGENVPASTVSTPGITSENADVDHGTTVGADELQFVSPRTEALADPVNGAVHEPSPAQRCPAQSSINDENLPLPLVEGSIRDKLPTAVRSDIPSPRLQSSPTRQTGDDLLERSSRSSKAGTARKSQFLEAESLRADGIGPRIHPARKSSPRLDPVAETQDNLDNDDFCSELKGNSAEEQSPTLPSGRSERSSEATTTAAAEEGNGFAAAPVDEEQCGTAGASDDAALETLSSGRKRKKRAFSHSTSRSRINRPERADVSPKIDFSRTDLSDPWKLPISEIIRRAEAIERKKVKAEGSNEVAKNVNKEKRGAASDAAFNAAPDISLNPQLHIVNGRIQINENTMTVGAQETRKKDIDTYVRVEENASKLNYNSYLNKAPVERWKLEDTELFYKALQQFGTDFELILNLFPGRNRRQIKAKYKKEEKNNPMRLQAALAYRPEDQVHYTEMITRLKAKEPESGADDPFASIIADTNAVSSGENVEAETSLAADEQIEKM